MGCPKFIFALIIGLMIISLASAGIVIREEEVSKYAIKELNKPAIFNLYLTNTGEADVFTIYSLVGIKIEPAESIAIGAGETKPIVFKAYPTVPLKVSPDYYSFEYKIKGNTMGIEEKSILIVLVNIKDAFDITFDDLTPESTKAVLHIKNNYGGPLENISLRMSSDLFSETKAFSLGANEQSSLEIALNPEKMKSLYAGKYIVDINLDVEGKNAQFTKIINFNEKEGIQSTEQKSGFMIQKYEAEKTNSGNTGYPAVISVRKNIFSGMFTDFNIAPTSKERGLFSTNFIFQRQLSPGESLRVVAKTNWWILLLIVVALIFLGYMIDKYLRNKLILSKSVHFVRTKGGEFALRVSVHLKARDFVERIRIIERLPPMVKFFEKHNFSNPDKIDEVNRRVEWNIQALSKGEERIFNYIIYSKISPVGKFELLPAEAIYEFEGNIKEAHSNTVIYSNEPA